MLLFFPPGQFKKLVTRQLLVKNSFFILDSLSLFFFIFFLNLIFHVNEISKLNLGNSSSFNTLF